MKESVKIHGWVARDPDTAYPVLFSDRPRRWERNGCEGWTVSHPLDNYFDLPELSFPGLKWEDEPIGVEITITSK